ncbi:MAG: M48 family metallopeptidase [Oscillospiraceae bacterium]|jgi:predicted metal-dependent hydrolase|nr:M48 family metallopeptidase [Oscillospiraceae bacterium]
MNKISLPSRTIEYELVRKRVKNINLRIRPNGTVYVSANKRGSIKTIEDFLRKKSDFILTNLDKFEKIKRNTPAERARFSDEECRRVLTEIAEKTYPHFIKYGVPFPKLKFRDMTSRWGSCQPRRGIITLNKRLLEVPRECAEYVVIHEFAHFIHLNHSKQFYEFLGTLMPDWKERRTLLREWLI